MKYAIGECSPKAKEKIVEGIEDSVGVTNNTHHRTKYPFDALLIGQCFTVPDAEANETSLRQLAVTRGRATKKKFSVL